MKTDKKLRETTLSNQLKQETILSNQLKLTGMAIDAIGLIADMVRIGHKTVYMMLGEPDELELKEEPKEETPPGTNDIALQNAAATCAMSSEKVLPPPETKSKTSICSICGKEFEKQSHSQKYCSKACAKHGAKQKEKEWHRTHSKNAAPLIEHGNTLSLAECQRIDKEYGVSYGEGERLGLHKRDKKAPEGDTLRGQNGSEQKQI